MAMFNSLVGRSTYSLNVLNKVGYISDQERKLKFIHSTEDFSFHSCIDLSEPIIVIPFGEPTEVSVSVYSKNVAQFICWWTVNVMKDLNGFSGFSNIKFKLDGFVIV